MDSPEKYIQQTQKAVLGLFDLLKQYIGDDMRSLVGIVKMKDAGEQRKLIDEIKAGYVAREAIAGSILQIAYMGLKRHSPGGNKIVLIKQIEAALPQAKNKAKGYDPAFCVGRCVGDIPIGLLIYAGRNQYSHQDERCLAPKNKLIFKYLDSLFKDQYKNNITFDLYDPKAFNYAYSILAAMTWLPYHKQPNPYELYEKDMRDMLKLIN